MISSVKSKKISSAQMRAARAMLRWSALDLARLSKVGVATIRRVEVIDGEIPVTAANEAAIRQALEAAGIEFIDEDRAGEGVRFRKPQRANRK
jgi:hypothetical protein